MNPTLHTHIKHILIAAGILLVAYVAINRWRDMRAKEIDSQTQIAVKQAEAQAKQGQQQVAQGQSTIIVADRALQQRVADLEAQRQQHLTSDQSKTQIEGMLPGVTVTSTTDATGAPVLQVPNTQLVRDAINGASADYKTCQFTRDNCQMAREQYEKVIVPGLNTQVAAKQTIIDQQDKDLKVLRARQVAPFMVGFGVGKAQGTSFRSASSYQPDVLFGYRFDQRLGVFVNAQNNSVAAGFTWNIGGKK